VFQLAEHLHKTVAEIEALTVAEFNGWVAYLQLKHEREQAERKRHGA
jgi:uncharacterized small protein (DUF1192 family)